MQILPTDVDECLIGNGDCDHTCHNTHGSSYCTCYGGFALQPDGKTCLCMYASLLILFGIANEEYVVMYCQSGKIRPI